MNRTKRKRSLGATHQPGEVRLVCALLVLVIVPTVAVLWFVNVAVRNERLANEQRLSAAYRAHLVASRQQVGNYLENILRQAESTVRDSDPQTAFGEIVGRGLAEGAIVFAADGELLYPTAEPPVTSLLSEDSRWDRARDLEFREQAAKAAGEIYRQIAHDAPDTDQRGRAWQSSVRCLVKEGNLDEAADITFQAMQTEPLVRSRDEAGRLIVPNLELLMIEQASKSESPLRADWIQSLLHRLGDYRDTQMPAAQRRYLGSRLMELSPAADFPATLIAEDLAARYLESSEPTRLPPGAASILQPTPLERVWQLTTADQRVVLLMSDAFIAQKLQQVLGENDQVAEVSTRLIPPGATGESDKQLSVDVGRSMPGWQLSVASPEDAFLEHATAEQTSIYIAIGLAVVVMTGVLAIIVSRSMHRHLRLAEMRNDLVGTVSHELRTPLASMRVLIDTLLDADEIDGHQTREYLQLVAKENSRLSRLIENFLMFSRFERGRQTFEFQPVDPATLVNRVVDAAGPRFRVPVNRLKVSVENDLPPVRGDQDALIIVLLNLLDNAYKYSPPDSPISLDVTGRGTNVCWMVTDGGCGMSRKEAKRVFQKFYQVDSRLTRNVDGCGLGLSIGQSIVKAHGGAIAVKSQPGRGSCFTVSLPVMRAAPTLLHEVEK